MRTGRARGASPGAYLAPVLRRVALPSALVALACASPGAEPVPAARATAAAGPEATVLDAPRARGGRADTLGEPAWLAASPAGRVAVLTGRLDPAADTGFVALAPAYTDGDGTYLLRREAAAALAAMIDAARADGVELRVRSATRDHARQTAIWEAKWRGERTLSNGVNLAEASLSDSAKARMILLYSSMPGTSRHHWGTDVDLNAFDNAYFDAGRGAAEYAWLRAHAGAYGFRQPYTDKSGGRTGYEEERWHWSYAPLAVALLRAYAGAVDYGDIGGFAGAEVAPAVGAIEEYVLGVNPELLPGS